ncbi:hypothetical protein D068_cds08550 [Bacillus atrophaeus UCMB-5137]|nr:hypothetical protein D068_cds08550 [Bacillus atrophaeus UCMB-5137]
MLFSFYKTTKLVKAQHKESKGFIQQNRNYTVWKTIYPASGMKEEPDVRI